MRVISAFDAVSAAIHRTRDFLFHPFRWGTFLKLGLVAIITEGIGSNLQSSSHHGRTTTTTTTTDTTQALSSLHLEPEKIAIIVFALLFALVVAFFVFYLITRLRFAFFHCLATNTRAIRPGWHFYREPAKRFFWLNLAVGVGFILVAAALILPFATGIWHLIQNTPHGGRPDIFAILILVLPLIPIFILLALAGVVADIVLRDWMLPHFALEDATAGQAWASVWARIRQEKRQFLVYTLLRVILPTIASIALFIVLLIPGAFLFGSLAAIEYGLHSSLASSPGASAVIGIVLEVFFGLIAFGLLLLAGICLGGPVSTGLREYALLFYGSRYQVLGDLLVPATATSTPPLQE